MPSRKPNVIVITCHDLGRHLGCYGVGTVRSPNVDGLAAEGVRFAHSFCTAPQCSPSRASLFTGRYPHSNGVLGLTHGSFGWDLSPDERHLAQILAESGWQTVMCGVHHESQDAGKAGYQRVLRAEGAEAAPRAAEAIEFIRQRPPDSPPFFLHLGFVEPHRLPGPGGFGPTALDGTLGVTVPEYLVDEPSAREDFAAFQGAIYGVDRAIGQLLAALEGGGLREDTVVVMTTDHGIPFPRAKCSLYDPGLEVCLIVRWPRGGWSGGQVYREPISNVDYLPTLLELLEIPVPERVQGRSFAPLVGGGAYQPRSEIFGEMTYHDYCDPIRCIRTEEHKLIVSFTSAHGFMDPSQSWRPKTKTRHPEDPRRAYHEPVELYDLAADPLEARNLAGAAEHRAVRQDLLGRLYGWMRETEDPLLEGIPTPPMHRRALAALRGEADSVQRPERRSR